MKKKNSFFDIDTSAEQQTSAPIVQESEVSIDRSSSKKQIAIILICIFALIALFFIVRAIYYLDGSDSTYFPESWTNGTNDRVPNLKFYAPDWESDILNDPEYLALKGDIIYSPNSSVSFAVTENDYFSAGGAGLVFMADYINAVIAGDYETLNEMFTEDYFKKNEPYEPFTQQRLYDIKITKYNYSDPQYQDTNVDDEYYIVSYKIDRNDGLFRNDFDQESELAQMFEIFIFDNGDVKIDNIFALPGYKN